MHIANPAIFYVSGIFYLHRGMFVYREYLILKQTSTFSLYPTPISTLEEYYSLKQMID